ncbi:invasion associated locus b family protein [Methylorubrum extorquens]|uniref:invasion associated locus b family protein n=1 Tax=Methylorubrum extorquens TaxID=408 RepID=UPI0009729120|nr:invasion associated locus b family protein [Methylorubrum extorquens]APX86269.1 invasion associated locus b family protein [Methylorubrum extorquens]
MQRHRLSISHPAFGRGRPLAALVLAAAAAAALPGPSGRALAQEGIQGAEIILARSSGREPKSSALPPGMQQAVPLAVFGDWNVFTNGAQGRDKLCYVIAQPTTRSPKTLARDTGYLFVTFPKGGAQGEIAVMLGFKPKPAAAQAKPGAAAAPSDPYLTVGSTRYGLVAKDENAWIQNQADEPRIVTEMSRTQTATVRTTSQRGKPTQDDYALGGFADALKRAREECK